MEIVMLVRIGLIAMKVVMLVILVMVQVVMLIILVEMEVSMWLICLAQRWNQEDSDSHGNNCNCIVHISSSFLWGNINFKRI